MSPEAPGKSENPEQNRIDERFQDGPLAGRIRAKEDGTLDVSRVNAGVVENLNSKQLRELNDYLGDQKVEFPNPAAERTPPGAIPQPPVRLSADKALAVQLLEQDRSGRQAARLFGTSKRPDELLRPEGPEVSFNPSNKLDDRLSEAVIDNLDETVRQFSSERPGGFRGDENTSNPKLGALGDVVSNYLGNNPDARKNLGEFVDQVSMDAKGLRDTADQGAFVGSVLGGVVKYGKSVAGDKSIEQAFPGIGDGVGTAASFVPGVGGFLSAGLKIGLKNIAKQGDNRAYDVEASQIRNSINQVRLDLEQRYGKNDPRVDELVLKFDDIGLEAGLQANGADN